MGVGGLRYSFECRHSRVRVRGCFLLFVKLFLGGDDYLRVIYNAMMGMTAGAYFLCGDDYLCISSHK